MDLWSTHAHKRPWAIAAAAPSECQFLTHSYETLSTHTSLLERANKHLAVGRGVILLQVVREAHRETIFVSQDSQTQMWCA